MTNTLTKEQKTGETLFVRGINKMIDDYDITVTFQHDWCFTVIEKAGAEVHRAAGWPTNIGLAEGLEKTLDLIVEASSYDGDYVYIRNKLHNEISALRAFGNLLFKKTEAA